MFLHKRFFHFVPLGTMQKNLFILLLPVILLFGCKGENQDDMEHKYTNDLIHETSPYLLQHAHNPVNWKAWNDETLKEAKESGKLILISVGYAACHWCHVMERESFEDSLVASIMNEKFINIKVDREERPDVDQVYMNAVQLMTGRGGWPLNVIALPDARPVWGGTYFKKEQWISALDQITTLYEENPDKLVEYADKLEQGIKSLDVINVNADKAVFEKDSLKNVVESWKTRFDPRMGGMRGAPKFMMPNNLSFLMRYAFQYEDDEIQDHVKLSLDKMAYGGIYDHIGGGFSRYSVDDRWHVPHFEKMLYDNAQLVSLYSDAYLLTKDSLYMEVVSETLDFIKRELSHPEVGFYSSLDADSETEDGELEEGAFYVWKIEELKNALGEDYNLFASYYNVNDYGIWEKDTYVLVRTKSKKEFIEEHQLSIDDLDAKLKSWKKTLFELREKRTRPRLDDKILTSWNALMISGYADAYRVFGKEEYLSIALKNAQFIIDEQLRTDGGLNHSYKEGKSTINGYLEDYAASIQAFLKLYELTFDEKWLNHSRNLANYCFDHFYDDRSNLFYFTSDEDSALITRQMEFRDNVIPASNSIMAKNLFRLYHYFDNESYLKTSTNMLNNVLEELTDYPSSYSNWMDHYMNFSNDFYEVAIVGSEVKEKTKEMNSYYLPNIVLVGDDKENDLPLLNNRYVEDRTLIYVCVNKACKLPVTEVEESLKFISK